MLGCPCPAPEPGEAVPALGVGLDVRRRQLIAILCGALPRRLLRRGHVCLRCLQRPHPLGDVGQQGAVVHPGGHLRQALRVGNELLHGGASIGCRLDVYAVRAEPLHQRQGGGVALRCGFRQRGLQRKAPAEE